MDTADVQPPSDAALTKPGLTTQVEERRTYYLSLEGSAVGGRYQLERLVDFGSMGAVFRARSDGFELRKGVGLAPTHDSVQCS